MRFARRIGACAALIILLGLVARPHAAVGREANAPFLAAPIWVYNNWSAYDELSDGVPLTETLALRELREMVRLRRDGVRLDYYVMDAFWFDPDGGYRVWRKRDWPNGPDAWLAACKQNGIKPGLWFSTNTLVHLNAVPQWRSSLNTKRTEMAMYTGGFLPDFIKTLQYWYNHGVRLFKLDFADFGAAAAGDEKVLTARQIRVRNIRALRGALAAFRRRNPEAVLVAFNGFAGDVSTAFGEISPSDVEWLKVFDTLYSGDPRPSNVPQMNFWRSVDIYSDRMVRHYEEAGVPLSRIDATGFMIGDTGTIYGRGTSGWEGMLLLTLARGGWINTIHGKLEYLDDAKARWFAKVQAMYAPLQKAGVTRSFGGKAGDRIPYGFGSADAGGSLYVAVNQAERVQAVTLPDLPAGPRAEQGGRVLFRDAGFDPVLDGNSLRLGPGELALVGYGRYATPEYDLGTGSDIRIPRAIQPLDAGFSPTGQGNTVAATLMPPSDGDLRIVLRQQNEAGHSVRSFAPFKNMGTVFAITASQDGKALPVEIHYDRIVWSGLAWAVGEIRRGEITPGEPIAIRLTTKEDDPALHLDGRVYGVEY